MLTSSQVETALRSMEDTFLLAMSGNATQLVQGVDSSAAALGQQLNGRVGQRGLHGSAAGLLVLGGSAAPQALSAVQHLVRYLENRSSIEQSLRADDAARPHVDSSRIDEDNKNTIKIAELIFALEHVPSGWVQTEDFRRRLVTELTADLTMRDGWTYDLTADKTEVAVLPTAFAVRALYRHGIDVTRQIDYLKRVLSDTRSNQSDISVQVFVLFILAYLDDSVAPTPELRVHFDRLWGQLNSLLSQDLEANIEYVLDGEYKYVRVPWQLYLIACAAKLRPYRRFATSVAQERARSVLKSITSGSGLTYPHSGDTPSTRTNAIVHDSFKQIEGQLRIARLPFFGFELLDRLSQVLQSTPVLWITRLLVAVFLGWASYEWLQGGIDGLGDLGPNALAAVLMAVFATRSRRPK